MKVILLAITLLSAALFSSIPAIGQTVSPTEYYSMLNWDTSPFKSYRYTRPEVSWEWINFRLLFPNGYDSLAQDNKKYPIIIMLHGAGESGRMEWNNTTKTNTPYPRDDPRRDNNDHQLMFGGREHLAAVQSGRFPGFVLFPQNSYGVWVDGKGEASSDFHPDLKKATELLEYLVKKLKIDPSRIYIHGLSAGGKGVWLAAHKRPDLFAAALPMSAPGDPAMAEQLKTMPLWVFQGMLDTNPRPASTKKTVEAIKDAGGEVRYTEYEDIEHNTWTRAYREKDFFEWMLGKSKGNSGTLNQAPNINAGEDRSISLPATTASFTATATDPDGTIASWLWEQTAGAEVTMSETNTETLAVSGLTAGTYKFRISVRDNNGALASDELTLVVNPGANQAPVVNAGEDKTINLPAASGSFTANATDADGSIASWLWEQTSGPEELVISGAATATISVSNLAEGVYTLKVTVKDNAGAIAWDEVKLTVLPVPNKKPLVNAGKDVVISLPENSATFTATASDPDGSVVAWLWEKTEGPELTLSGVSTATLSVTDLVKGKYVFKVTVTDNGGAVASDYVVLAVFEDTDENQLPLAHAGSDTVVYLPIDKLILEGSAFDADGSMVSYLWEKVSGPEAGMANTDSRQLELSNLEEGVYVFRFSATDEGGATASDEVSLTVKPAIVNAVDPSEEILANISAYPNPFDSFIHIELELPGQEQIQVVVYDMLARPVFRGSFTSIPGKKITYRIDFPPGKTQKGAYFIRAGNAEGTFRKVIKVVKP